VVPASELRPELITRSAGGLSRSVLPNEIGRLRSRTSSREGRPSRRDPTRSLTWAQAQSVRPLCIGGRPVYAGKTARTQSDRASGHAWEVLISADTRSRALLLRMRRQEANVEECAWDWTPTCAASARRGPGIHAYCSLLELRGARWDRAPSWQCCGSTAGGKRRSRALLAGDSSTSGGQAIALRRVQDLAVSTTSGMWRSTRPHEVGLRSRAGRDLAKQLLQDRVLRGEDGRRQGRREGPATATASVFASGRHGMREPGDYREIFVTITSRRASNGSSARNMSAGGVRRP